MDDEEAEGFATLGEALAALTQYLDPDGLIEVHADGCDGRAECGCGFVTLSASQVASGGEA